MKIYQWKSSLFYEEISPTAKLTGMAISEFYRDGKECFPSLPTIMEITGHNSINTIRKAIQELKDNSLIDVKHKIVKGRGGRPVNSYIFLGVNEQLANNDSSSDSSSDSSIDISDELAVELANNDREVTNKPINKKTNKLSKEDFALIFKTYKPNYRVLPKLDSVDYKRCNNVVKELGSVNEVIKVINEYFKYLSTEDWRKPKGFKEFMNSSEHYGNNWLAEIKGYTQPAKKKSSLREELESEGI